MNIEKAVYQILSANAGLTALVSADKIYPDDETQNVALPFIKHFQVSSQPVHTHGGLATLEISDFYQVSVFASSKREARLIAEAVKAALDGVHELDTSPVDGLTAFYENDRSLPFDFDVRAAGIAIDFRIAYPRG